MHGLIIAAQRCLVFAFAEDILSFAFVEDHHKDVLVKHIRSMPFRLAIAPGKDITVVFML
jgi:hypothetical protein